MAAALESRIMLTSTLPTIGTLAFTNTSSNYGMASGNFAGSLTNASPSSYYTIEIDTNGDQLADVTGSGFMDSFQASGTLPIGTTSLQARVSEYDMATGQFLSSPWQTFTVSDGVVANTLPVISGVAFTNPSAAAGQVTGDFTGVLTDTTAALYYTVEIDTTGDQLADLSGMVGPGGFTLQGTVSEGTTAITVRVQEYVDATGQYEFSNWQPFTITGTEGGSSTGGTTTTTPTEETTAGPTPSPTTPETSSGSGTTSDTSTSSETTTTTTSWTMANGTVLDTSAADAGFGAAIFGANVQYWTRLGVAAIQWATDNVTSWNTYVGSVHDANTQRFDTDNTSRLNHEFDLWLADTQLEISDELVLDAYFSDIADLLEQYDADIELAGDNYDSAMVRASSLANTDDATSFVTYQGKIVAADDAFDGKMLGAGIRFGLVLTSSSLQYAADVLAAQTAFGLASMALTDPNNPSPPVSTPAPLDLANDSLYQSDLASAQASYNSAVQSAQNAYDLACDIAEFNYDWNADLAWADYTSELADHAETFGQVYFDEAVAYWLEADLHAATANTDIATAEFNRDIDLLAANIIYWKDIERADTTRAGKTTQHTADYEAGEGPALTLLQGTLATLATAHATSLANAVNSATGRINSAWNSFDAVISNSVSTSTDRDNALAARLTAIAGALADYNNSIAVADAAHENGAVGAWAGYDTTVNGLLTTYQQKEAQADADREHAYNAAYVAWANSAELAWVNFDDDVADTRGRQRLDDASSEKDFHTNVNLAWKAADIADAGSRKDYDDALTDLTQAFYDEILAPWVTMVDAKSNASAALRVANANAEASAVGRWAALADTPGATYEAALSAAFAADIGRVAPAEAIFNNERHAATKDWYDAVVPAWVTYEKDISTHSKTWSITMAGEAETYWNAVASANKAYVDGEVPLGIAATYDMGTNLLTWVNDVALADETYGNELADHAVTYTISKTNASKQYAADRTTHWSSFVFTKNGLTVTYATAYGEALTNWAGTIAGQLTGTPYTPPATTVNWDSTNPGTTTTTTTVYGATAPASAENPFEEPSAWDGYCRYFWNPSDMDDGLEYTFKGSLVTAGGCLTVAGGLAAAGYYGVTGVGSAVVGSSTHGVIPTLMVEGAIYVDLGAAPVLASGLSGTVTTLTLTDGLVIGGTVVGGGVLTFSPPRTAPQLTIVNGQVVVVRNTGNGGFSGNNGFQLGSHPLQTGRNAPMNFGRLPVSGHALDQMQNRGIMPSVLDNAIRTGTSVPGSQPGTRVFIDSVNHIRVVINSNTGNVITVISGDH